MSDKNLALRLKLNRLTDCGINAPIIFHETNPGTSLVQGWCTVEGSTCWHVWVEMPDGTVVDVIRTLAILMNPLYKNSTFTLSKEGKGEMDQETLDNWEMYQKDPKVYWSKQPKKIKDFKSRYKAMIR
jgi:hypothetical protein